METKIINGRRQNMFEPINQINTSNFYKILPESKSSLRQDMFVLNEFKFKRDGYFIELGAADGFDSSNTHLLEYKFNWKGILVEAAKIWHIDLKENRKGNIETNCIWKTSGDELIFNEVPTDKKSELSTIDIFSNKAFGKKYKVKTISLADLLLKYNAPKQIDYLSIDTEGSEFEILNAFDFNLYDIKIITCEHNATLNKKKIYNLLINNGYKRKFEEFSNPNEDWYVRK
jgi:FkbM family methyltransferase